VIPHEITLKLCAFVTGHVLLERSYGEICFGESESVVKGAVYGSTEILSHLSNPTFWGVGTALKRVSLCPTTRLHSRLDDGSELC
jgi:hypothetical protein